MILGRDLLTTQGLNLKFSEYVIIGSDGSYKGLSAPIADVTYYSFKPMKEKNSNRKNPLIICTSTYVLSQKAWLVQPRVCIEY